MKEEIIFLFKMKMISKLKLKFMSLKLKYFLILNINLVKFLKRYYSILYDFNKIKNILSI